MRTCHMDVASFRIAGCIMRIACGSTVWRRWKNSGKRWRAAVIVRSDIGNAVQSEGWQPIRIAPLLKRGHDGEPRQTVIQTVGAQTELAVAVLVGAVRITQAMPQHPALTEQDTTHQQNKTQLEHGLMLYSNKNLSSWPMWIKLYRQDFEHWILLLRDSQ